MPFCPLLDDASLFDAVVVVVVAADNEDAAADVDNLEVMRMMLLLRMALVLCRGFK